MRISISEVIGKEAEESLRKGLKSQAENAIKTGQAAETIEGVLKKQGVTYVSPQNLQSKSVNKFVNETKKATTKASAQKSVLTSLQENQLSFAKKAASGAGLIIAAGTIVDIARKKKEKMEVKAQSKELERRQEKKIQKEQDRRKRYRDGEGFGHVDTSKVVMGLFDERLGHFKMGNSRFR